MRSETDGPVYRNAIKRGAALLLVGCALVLWLWKPAARPPKVELLPFPAEAPAWDGSDPYLTISLGPAGSGKREFKSAVLLIKPTAHHEESVNEFQVDLHSGMFLLRQTDLFVGGTMPLSLSRTFRSWDCCARAFGMGMNHPYDICPTGTRFPYTYMDLNLEDGRQIHFRRISKGTGYADAVFGHDATDSEFYGAKITWDGDGWTLDFRDGRRFRFPEAYHAKNYAQGAAVEMQDAAGDRILLKRDQQRNLEQLIASAGRAISFKYDAANRIIEAKDDAGEVREYSYDDTGHLQSVADGERVLYRFGYARVLNWSYDRYLMTAIFDGDGRTLLANRYASGGQVSEQRLSDGEVIHYDYIFKNQDIVETIVHDATGERKIFFQSGIFAKEE